MRNDSVTPGNAYTDTPTGGGQAIAYCQKLGEVGRICRVSINIIWRVC